MANCSSPILTQQPQGQSSQLSGLSALLPVLVSFPALYDWLKVIMIGGVLETCRRFASSLYHKAVSSFFITAYFEDDDDSWGALPRIPCYISR